MAQHSGSSMHSPLDYQLFYREKLPHYQPAEGVFFITYRLAFSLPQKILQQRQQKLREFQARCEGLSQSQQRSLAVDFAKILFAQEDQFFARYQQSPQWLQHDAIAAIVLEALHFHHTKQYELICVLVMSNHVHIVIKPLLYKPQKPYSFAQIMKDHKSYTAQKANKILGRNGQFWWHENYDHWVRDGEELKRIINYILQNPVKAGLINNYQEWPHYWVDERYLQ